MINRSQVSASFRPSAAGLFVQSAPLAAALVMLFAALAAPASALADERGWAASSGANGLGRTSTTGFRLWTEVGGGEEDVAVIVPTLGLAFRYDIVEVELVVPMAVVDGEFAMGNPQIGSSFFKELDNYRIRAGVSFNFPLPVGERQALSPTNPDLSPALLIQNQRRANWYLDDSILFSLNISQQVDLGPVTIGIDGEYIQLLPTCNNQDPDCPTGSLFVNAAGLVGFWALDNNFQGGVRALFSYSPSTAFVESQFGIEPFAAYRIGKDWLVAVRGVLPITPLDLSNAWGAYGSIVVLL